MVKKIFGVLFVGFAALLGLGTAVQIPRVILDLIAATQAEEGKIGYLLGKALGGALVIVVFGLIAFFVGRWGVRWLAPPAAKVPEILDDNEIQPPGK